MCRPVLIVGCFCTSNKRASTEECVRESGESELHAAVLQLDCGLPPKSKKGP